MNTRLDISQKSSLFTNEGALVEQVRDMMRHRLFRRWGKVLPTCVHESLTSGKLLRTKFASRLLDQGIGRDVESMPMACGAIELVHTASLCHDDVIDGGQLRRSQPSLWRSIGAAKAVLVGDVLLCESIDLLAEAASGLNIREFIQNVAQMCQAEVKAEFHLRNHLPSREQTLCQVREKTGSLFAFLGRVAGNDDVVLADALEETGYCVGAAYQLADDILDVVSRPKECGKTTGLDAQTGRRTLAREGKNGLTQLRNAIVHQCIEALRNLEKYPQAQQAVAIFLRKDMHKAWDIGGIASRIVEVTNLRKQNWAIPC